MLKQNHEEKHLIWEVGFILSSQHMLSGAG